MNREHPAVSVALSDCAEKSDIARLVTLMERSLPAHDIHLHISNDQPLAEAVPPDLDELRLMAARLAEVFADQPTLLGSLLDRLHLTAPFDQAPDTAREIAESLRR